MPGITVARHALITHTSAMIGDGEVVNADISPTANIGWGKISKVGSSLADLETRLHTSLTGIGPDDHHAQLHKASHDVGAVDELPRTPPLVTAIDTTKVDLVSYLPEISAPASTTPTLMHDFGTQTIPDPGGHPDNEVYVHFTASLSSDSDGLWDAYGRIYEDGVQKAAFHVWDSPIYPAFKTGSCQYVSTPGAHVLQSYMTSDTGTTMWMKDQYIRTWCRYKRIMP